MSVRILSRVWDGFPGAGSDLLALLALADWSDDEGRCFPSMASIARKTRLSRSQAQRVVHGLIKDGFVRVTGNETGGSPGSTRQYRINLSSLTGSADATPTGRTHATGCADATGRTHAQEGSHGCTETGRAHATQTVNEPSTNPQPVRDAEKPHRSTSVDSVPDGFDVFWESYPRKVAKPQAIRAWRALKATTKTQAALMAGLERAKMYDQWQRDRGRFIPYPATWLNARRWEDEPDTGVPSGGTDAGARPKAGDTRTRHGVAEVFTDGAGWVPA